jgi:transcriptional regulator with XRE-family HTH domain
MAMEVALEVDFATRLRVFREQRGLSQNALAARMGTNASMVLRVERGERAPRDRAWVEDAAAALELSPDERDDLLVAAGYVPAAVFELGMARHPALVAFARALAEPRPATDRDQLGRVVQQIVDWYRAPSSSPAPAGPP